MRNVAVDIVSRLYRDPFNASSPNILLQGMAQKTAPPLSSPLSVMNTELRKLLEEIPKRRCDEHENLLNSIRSNHKHSIFARDSQHLFHKWGTYNCFEYALGLTDFSDYVVVKKQKVFANSAFIRYLLRNNLLVEQNKKNGVIIYFSEDGQPKHAGKLTDNRVLSKWGTGLLFAHEIFGSSYEFVGT